MKSVGSVEESWIFDTVKPTVPKKSPKRKMPGPPDPQPLNPTVSYGQAQSTIRVFKRNVSNPYAAPNETTTYFEPEPTAAGSSGSGNSKASSATKVPSIHEENHVILDAIDAAKRTVALSSKDSAALDRIADLVADLPPQLSRFLADYVAVNNHDTINAPASPTPKVKNQASARSGFELPDTPPSSTKNSWDFTDMKDAVDVEEEEIHAYEEEGYDSEDDEDDEEQGSGLAEALYARWLGNLRNRWSNHQPSPQAQAA